ncbi:DUF2917 domain-containing protein [Ramlibacter albus]|uniref:DUF2917 domain-containing protein n=1 Tax=Ramlibacter albus TaxID=2079448 RepID=A0A923S5K3_9BURK|nr:DUF2917 domain-containing protein [Ramlibacter albus]MBC5768083.1 DUF2917 domain-containing protein [Ramlibacter albus]
MTYLIAHPAIALHNFIAAVARASRTPAQPAVYDIAAREVQEIRRAAGRTVRCTAGSVWLTQDASQDDIVLEAGQSWRCTGRSRVLAQGLGGARVVVC